jgi:hypothetical protein
VQYEKKVIKKELADCSYGQYLYEALLRKITGQKINLNHLEPIAFEEIVSYHQQRYKESNMVICDDDFKVLFEGYTIKEKKKES